MADSVQITEGSGTPIAAELGPGGSYIQIVSDPALSGGVLDQILAELKRMNLILCTMARLDHRDFEDTKL